MIFTHPLNLEVKSLLVHTDRVREAYNLNPPKSDKSLQLLLEVKAKVKRGPCLGWGGNVCSNLGPLAISHTAHPRSVFPLGRLAHPGNIDLLERFFLSFRVLVSERL